MKANLEKRLKELEKVIKTSEGSALWVDGLNATIRVDVNRKRGKEVIFPSVYEARVWLEKQIDGHSGCLLSYCVDDICDLYENQSIRSIVDAFLPEGTKIPATLFHGIKPGLKADICLRALVSLIGEHFNTYGFSNRWSKGETNDNDNALLSVIYSLFRQDREGEDLEIFYDFTQLFFAKTKINLIDWEIIEN